uniref:Uncharacterized protein n=1 Tax=Arundo donax TaxID=35708 RepID=A0A0A9B0W1_ARUDO
MTEQRRWFSAGLVKRRCLIW